MKDYENTAVGFEEYFQQINTFINNPVLEIEGIVYKLQFFMCCDYNTRS